MLHFNKKEKKKTAKQVTFDEIAPWLEDHVENSLMLPRYDAILRSWLLDDKAYGEIAIDFKISRERVRQIIHGAVVKIKRDLEKEQGIAVATEVIVKGAERFNYDVRIFSTDPRHSDVEKIKAILLMPVTACELSVRLINCLMAEGVRTVEDILKAGRERLKRFRAFGPKSMGELENFLAKMNLKWRGNNL